MSQGLARLFVVIIFVIAGISVFGWMTLLDYCSHAPLTPNVVTHQVVPFDNHGTIHYILRWQDFLVHWDFLFFLPLLMAGNYFKKFTGWQ